MKKLFGSPAKQVASQSGFGALPSQLQSKFTQLGNLGGDIMSNANQYFSPMGLTGMEQQAGQMIDPANFGASIQQFLNPFRDIITQDINKAYGDQSSALASRASEAGAFGGSRMRQGESDLERARFDAIANAMSGQYNQAGNQMQQSIANLLGFGGLERGIDLAQRQAPVSAFSTVSSGLSPLLNTNTGGYTTTADSGLVGDVGKVAGLVGSIGGLFSDKRLKRNIKKVGEKNGLNTYEYEYLWSPQKFIGYMSDEVRAKFPKAVSQINGYDVVNYEAING